MTGNGSTERDPAVTSRIMAAVRSKDTGPEVALRSALWRRGLRFRKHPRLPGRPDIVFPGPRVAVFIDGDFWHGRGWRSRGLPDFESQFKHRNPDFWRAKLLRNMERDREVNRVLRRAGWRVIRVWESDVRRNVQVVARRVERAVREE